MRIEVGLLALHGARQKRRDVERIPGIEAVRFDVDGAIGALGQGLADGLRGARRAGAHHNHFAAVFFLELQRRFQGVRVGLVDFVAEIGVLNPAVGRVKTQRRIAGRNLLERNQDFHVGSATLW